MADLSSSPSSPSSALRVIVGLGANLGDRFSTMRAAVTRIEQLDGVDVVARSHVYETAPVGNVEQPAFLNAAIAVRCTRTPRELLEHLLVIERELGRSRGAGEVRWGPRTIDLDVLWGEDLVLDEPGLVIPHPRLHERAFALLPLLDVAPDARDPRTGAPYVAPSDEGVRSTDLAL